MANFAKNYTQMAKKAKSKEESKGDAKSYSDFFTGQGFKVGQADYDKVGRPKWPTSFNLNVSVGSQGKAGMGAAMGTRPRTDEDEEERRKQAIKRRLMKKFGDRKKK